MYGDNDGQTDEATEKWRLSKHVCWSLDSVQDLTVAYISRETRFSHKRYGRTDRRTDRRTDGRTDGPTDRPSYRDAMTHLKRKTEETNRSIVSKLGGSTFPNNSLYLWLRYLKSAFIYPNKINVWLMIGTWLAIEILPRLWKPLVSKKQGVKVETRKSSGIRDE